MARRNQCSDTTALRGSLQHGPYQQSTPLRPWCFTTGYGPRASQVQVGSCLLKTVTRKHPTAPLRKSSSCVPTATPQRRVFLRSVLLLVSVAARRSHQSPCPRRRRRSLQLCRRLPSSCVAFIQGFLGLLSVLPASKAPKASKASSSRRRRRRQRRRARRAETTVSAAMTWPVDDVIDCRRHVAPLTRMRTRTRRRTRTTTTTTTRRGPSTRTKNRGLRDGDAADLEDAADEERRVEQKSREISRAASDSCNDRHLTLDPPAKLAWTVDA